jgi:predicted Fe-Mo cluster-binding NifX family protein
MNICIPIDADRGLDSPVCAHFGAAPAFMIVDTERSSCRAIRNSNQHDGHGTCAPVTLLQGEQIDAMVVGGIGMGALTRLSAAGISVYASQQSTVGEAVAAFKLGTLKLMQPGMACTQHGHVHR